MVGSEECKKVISQSWGDNDARDSMPLVMNKICDSGDQLKKWNNESSGSVRKCIKEAETNLHRLIQIDPLYFRQTKHKEARGEVNKWLEREDIMWRQ